MSMFDYSTTKEAKFKVGDWVRSKEQLYPIYKVGSIVGNSLYDSTPNWIGGMPNMELWQPKENEYCWFWDKDFTVYPILGRYTHSEGENKHFCDNNSSVVESFDSIEPFIGELPTFIKDK